MGERISSLLLLLHFSNQLEFYPQQWNEAFDIFIRLCVHGTNAMLAVSFRCIQNISNMQVHEPRTEDKKQFFYSFFKNPLHVQQSLVPKHIKKYSSRKCHEHLRKYYLWHSLRLRQMKLTYRECKREMNQNGKNGNTYLTRSSRLSSGNQE